MRRLKLPLETTISIFGIIFAMMQVFQINPTFFPEVQYRVFVPLQNIDINKEIQSVYISNTGGGYASDVRIVIDYANPLILGAANMNINL